MQVLRVNIAENRITYEDIPESWQRLGGRALVARFMLDEVPPTCEPLGPFNKLIWAPGLLTRQVPLHPVRRSRMPAVPPRGWRLLLQRRQRSLKNLFSIVSF